MPRQNEVHCGETKQMVYPTHNLLTKLQQCQALHSRVVRHFSVQQNKMHKVQMPHRRCFDNRFTEPQVGEPQAGGRL